jgi:hypothetical protein
LEGQAAYLNRLLRRGTHPIEEVVVTAFKLCSEKTVTGIGYK